MANVSPRSLLPEHPPLASSALVEEITNLYEVKVKSSPPIINLERTPARYLFGAAFNSRLLEFARRRFKLVAGLSRIGVLAIFALWAAPAEISRWITPFATALSVPIVIVSPLMMSVDLLRLLVQTHEFWFFTVTNLSTWGTAAILFNDARMTGCIMTFLMSELAVLMDANFRTIVAGVRTSVAWIPAITCILIACTTRVADILPERFNVLIPRNKIDFDLGNFFLNATTTLVIFMGRQTLRRRRIMTAQFLDDRIIPCCTIRCDLVVQRMKPNNPMSKLRLDAFTKTLSRKGSHLLIDPTPQLEHARSDRTSSLQTMSVEAPTLPFLDMRKTLLPLMTPAARLSMWKSVIHYTIGMVGLLTAGATMNLPAHHDTHPNSPARIFGAVVSHGVAFVVIPVASLLCTVSFVLPFVASYQRDLLLAMRSNFDFCFTSLQFLISSVCVADMMHWDIRCLALVAWLIWVHWILLWDMLLPEIRARFRFRKIYGTPVLVVIFFGLHWILYSLFFSSYNALDDRILGGVSFDSYNMRIRTSTFLIGRLTTILMWSIRVVWKAIRDGEDDLVFICGRLEYHTPLEFFPTIEAPAQKEEGRSSRCGVRRLLQRRVHPTAAN